FSKMMLKRLELKDVQMAEITLHAGFSNFKPLEVEDLSKHRMDSEEMNIDEKACDIINKAKANGNKICVVGTTSMKAVETAVTVPGTVSPFSGWTNKFIYAPYNFSIADMMVTNFHPPMTSMMIMASAFAGYDLLMEAYRVAMKEKYKFYTYGDAMLIL
ncbi:MAG: S-adenosylmethionine:tRNA ribosyltransferase-isomerase, partial [Bacteroidales bacterium]|nr:S-adenosylmethionine:tRNA ribosyltransferase-isomerase [Bacteroidales bacterium]